MKDTPLVNNIIKTNQPQVAVASEHTLPPWSIYATTRTLTHLTGSWYSDGTWPVVVHEG